MSSDITIIAGPTASGKSACAMDIAEKRNGVIINADALQIYADLPILTAQPDPKDQQKIPHALYGILAPDQVCNAAWWVQQTCDAITKAVASGHHPVVVGGTGMYLNALMHGLSPMPDVPDDIRASARTLQADMGNPAFHQHLSTIDPVMAARLNPNDSQRLIRAYEVIMATGQSLDTWQNMPANKPLPDAKFHTILVDGPRGALRARAYKRLHIMVDMGVIREVADYQAKIDHGDYTPESPPTRALGYHAFVDAHRGNIDIGTAITRAEIETGQYIKRQQTWLRHQMTFDEARMISL